MPNPMATGRTLERPYSVQVIFIPESKTLLVDTVPFLIPQTLREGEVQDFNQKFVTILDQVCGDVRRGIDLTGSSNNYMEKLRQVGKAAYNTFLDQSLKSRFVELEQRASQEHQDLGITFLTPSTYPLFWEMLYSGGAGGADPDFWGFRYPLGRAFIGPETPPLIQLDKGIFSAINEGLPCSLQEVEQLGEHLKQASDQLRRDLTIQVMGGDKATAVTVDQVLDLFHNADSFRYGIVHFACHCENPNPKDGDPLDAYFSFRQKGQPEIRLTLLTLQSEQQERPFVNKPFVFLNACESATPGHLMRSLNFPNSILHFGAGGVIATVCAIPDNFASAFATEFYKRLIQKNSGPEPLKNYIAEALLQTRIYFRDHYNNPLGLAYGLFARSDQRLNLGA